jgi:hypothetical protein
MTTTTSDMGDVQGTRRNPWKLQTADGAAAFTAWRDPAARQPALVIKAAAGEVRFNLRCLQDLHDMLTDRADWMVLGTAPEKGKPAADTVEAWARAASNPVEGWYGLTEGQRGHFALYVPPVMVALDLAELEPGAGGGRMRAT